MIKKTGCVIGKGGEKKMKTANISRVASLFAFALLFMVVLSATAYAESGVQVFEPADIDANQWKDAYPNEYYSWVDSVMIGTNGVQPGYSWDEKMGKPLSMSAAIKSTTPLGAGCVGCHSTAFVNMYGEYGGDVVTLTGTELIHESSSTTGITCYSCHGDTPGEMFVSKTYITEAAERGGIDKGDPNLVCAQCHALPNRAWEEVVGTTAEDRSFGVMGDTNVANWSTLEAGTNAEDVYAWFVDHGVKDPKVVIGEMEYQQYHGSTMDRLGVTCATCHMEKATAEDGTEYTRHAWQGANVNPAIYENCSTCHKTSAEEMQTHVLDLQASYQERLAEVTAALNDAQAAIEASDKDEAVIAEASDLWFEARFHSRYGQDSSEGIHGIGNANTDYCFDKCLDICKQIMDMV